MVLLVPVEVDTPVLPFTETWETVWVGADFCWFITTVAGAPGLPESVHEGHAMAIW